ncbi:MAG TPA: hypothetical protein VK727_07230 [Steroidobacteraceae bacterium]|jgi:hypothetical protein|nr:hypothetical protein [Steroidobacteraceae bacterium]
MIRALLMVGMATMARLVLAAGPDTHLISIPVEDLGTALLSLAAVTHQQIAFDYKSVEGYKSTALSGTYTAAEGLRVLIGAAPFLVRATPSGVLTVAAKQAPISAEASTGTDRPSFPGERTASASGALQDEVIISASRTQLAPKVSAFVNAISVPAQGEGLARWHMPVCPQVTGLQREDGEFVLWRISEVARAAGVPLAGEHCDPNLIVFLTLDPKQLLMDMEKRQRAVTFGHAAPVEIDEFIATPRVVRVWYNSAVESPDNFTPAHGFPPFAQMTGQGLVGNVTTDWEKASRVTRTVVRAFTRVCIVVDKGHLQGVTLGQLAAYIAMVGLAQIKPDAQLSDAPTILRLFDGTPQGALPGMSDWDLAFIKSMYATEQTVAVQRGEIARGMLREIVR